MNITEKEIYIITWDNQYSVFALKMSKKGKDLHIDNAVFAQGDGVDCFADNLADAYDQINIPSNKRRIIGGYLPSAVCIEFEMIDLPKNELLEAVEMELMQYIPYPIDEIQWNCIYNKMDDKVQVRIFVVPKNELNHLFSVLDEKYIKVDAFVYPFMVNDTSFEEKNLAMKGIDNDFIMSNVSDGVKEMKVAKYADNYISLQYILKKFTNVDIIEKKTQKPSIPFLPALLLGQYYLNGNFANQEQSFIKLPNKMIPQYFQKYKIIIAFFVLINILLALGLGARSYIDWNKRNKVVDAEYKKVSKRIKKVKLVNKKNSKDPFLVSLEKLEDIKMPPNAFLQAIKYLSKSLPDSIWIKDISSNKTDISVTLNSYEEIETKIIDSNKLFTIIPVRSSSRNRAGIITYERKLKMQYNITEEK